MLEAHQAGSNLDINMSDLSIHNLHISSLDKRLYRP
jgi:hypothetical protein